MVAAVSSVSVFEGADLPAIWAILSYHIRLRHEIPAISGGLSTYILDCFEPSEISGRVHPVRGMAMMRRNIGHVDGWRETLVVDPWRSYQPPRGMAQRPLRGR
jgi:hypothetical protein